MFTEQRNPNSMGIDQQPTLQILEIMNTEDATVAGVVRQTLPAVAQAVELIADRLRAGGRLIYIGAGTSGRLGILDAVECLPTFSVDPEMVQGIIAGGEGAIMRSVEGAEDDPQAGKSDLQAINLTGQDAVVGIAASGRTPYVVGALRYANEVEAGTVAISCNSPAPILDVATIRIAALVGPEILTGSTRLKAGTAQKLILNMISTATMIKLGKVYNNLMVDVRVSNQKLADRARGIVSEITGITVDEAAALLDQTGQEVKPAVVMAILGLSANEARRRLAEEQGMLAQVIHANAP